MVGREGYGQEEAIAAGNINLTRYATSTTGFIGAERGQLIAILLYQKLGHMIFKPVEEILAAEFDIFYLLTNGKLPEQNN